ncbi:hypothetical protein, partial [Bernardetia sp.]|uniref:hypothetical protein n=1 Tax=Bernardetia sp. TaxID=1937974 RepID=UPI0025C324BD
MNFTPIKRDTGLGAVSRCGGLGALIPTVEQEQQTALPPGTGETTKDEKISIWDRLKNSTILNTAADIAAQSLVSGGSVVSPDAYATTGAVADKKSWFEKDTLIPSVPNWLTTAGGTLLVFGTVY